MIVDVSWKKMFPALLVLFCCVWSVNWSCSIRNSVPSIILSLRKVNSKSVVLSRIRSSVKLWSHCTRLKSFGSIEREFYDYDYHVHVYSDVILERRACNFLIDYFTVTQQVVQSFASCLLTDRELAYSISGLQSALLQVENDKPLIGYVNTYCCMIPYKFKAV